MGTSHPAQTFVSFSLLFPPQMHLGKTLSLSGSLISTLSVPLLQEQYPLIHSTEENTNKSCPEMSGVITTAPFLPHGGAR